MKRKSIFRFFARIIIILILSLNGCVSYRKSDSLSLRLPEKFLYTGSAVVPDKWWKVFDDPKLNYLVEQALSGNLDVKIAWDRLDQAQAYLKIANASLWPGLSLDFNVADRRNVGKKEKISDEGTFYSPSIAATYELDLWGRLRAGSKAAEADLGASQEDLYTVAMTISAEVANAWYEGAAR